jgi:hypothetical protein
MKVHSAVIKLVLRTNKTLADGSHPIMLRVSYNGMKEVSTHCSCRKRDWDAKNMMVKKNVRNCVIINSTLRGVLRYYQDAKDALEASGEPYTASMVIHYNEAKEQVKNSSRLMDVEQRYESENAISPQSIPNRRSVIRMVEKYFDREDVDISEVTTEAVQGMIKHRLRNGGTEGYMKQCYRMLNSLVNYAIEKGYKVEKLDSKIGKRLAEGNSLVYIHWRSIPFIKEYLLNELTIRKKGGWTYKDDRYEELLNPHSSLFAIYLWLFSYLFQGLAPIDCALLKIKDIGNVRVGDANYWAIDWFRRKTRHSVKIRIRQDGVFNQVMIRTMLMFRHSEYLLPILDGVDENEQQKVRSRLSYCLATLRPLLREELSKVNDIIIAHNVSNNDNVPIINVDEVNYYAARHSYAMAYIHSPNANPIALATLLGRSVNTLGTYVHQLTEESDITAAADIIV